MDAIPVVATYHSAKFMYDMISANAISESEINFWLTSLSFVNEPTADIISTFTVSFTCGLLIFCCLLLFIF